MFITLTNSSPAHKGNPIVLNSDHIVSILNVEVVRDEDQPEVKERVTYLFCPPHGTWEAEESPEEIAKLINGK